jgi:ubiquinone/menaquinone biosynthesis C-methylase UbiE
MLNPAWDKTINDRLVDIYIASDEVKEISLKSNTAINSGKLENKIKKEYGDEIWTKLNRIGLTENDFNGKRVLEICAGPGFLTYHLLSRATPSAFYVNDISSSELELNKKLIEDNFGKLNIKYIHDDVHLIKIDQKIDIIIGNSFLHHFYDVPGALKVIYNLLAPGGMFISLHEPTLMSICLEPKKFIAYPITALFPRFTLKIARYRHKGRYGSEDLWLFESKKVKNISKKIGFKKINIIPYNLIRSIFSRPNEDINIGAGSARLKLINASTKLDGILNKFLPEKCFGSYLLYFIK